MKCQICSKNCELLQRCLCSVEYCSQACRLHQIHISACGSLKALQDLERPADTKFLLFRVTWNFPVSVGSPEMSLTKFEREDGTEPWSKEPHTQFPISMGTLGVATHFVELRREEDVNLLVNESLQHYFRGYGTTIEIAFVGRQGFRGHIRAYRYTIVEGMKVYEDMGIEDVRLMTISIFTRIFNINISRNLSLIIFKGTANWITAWIVHGFKDQQIVQEVKISKAHPIFTNPNRKISWISQRVKFPLLCMKLDQEQGKPSNIKAGYLTQIPFDQDVPGWPRETRDQWAILNLKTVLVARGDRGDSTAPQFEAFYKFGKEIYHATSKPTQDIALFLKNNVTEEKFEDFFIALKRQKSTFDFNEDWRAAATPYRKPLIFKVKLGHKAMRVVARLGW